MQKENVLYVSNNSLYFFQCLATHRLYGDRPKQYSWKLLLWAVLAKSPGCGASKGYAEKKKGRASGYVLNVIKALSKVILKAEGTDG